ncbi:LysR family transcriptional regulator [uncultured Xylophilus sp.]|uniref:LysR family transcriptional regulator n=1 Tax=uncultured Xylophilus sp. TaxID=296832 RepID=UPI0025EB08FC|nr:LysR family transcriptional regulator [uncultured Xylophilus sp.]
MRLDPVSLRLFVAVMEEGTIAAAAQREHIATAAVSRRISELEGQLAARLFARSNKGTEPTAAAYALLGLARGVLNGLDDIAAQMQGYADGVRGQVRVAANISAITQFLPAELRGFMDRYPQVQVHLQERISSAVVREVAENTADVGILNAGHYGEPRVAFWPYRQDELVLIVPRGHALARRRRVALREALPYDFVGMHPGSAINQRITQAAAENGLALRIRMQVTGYDALCLMVANGLGFGVLPRGSAALYLRALPLAALALDDPWARRELVLCVRSGGDLPPATRLLVEHLQPGDGGSALPAS